MSHKGIVAVNQIVLTKDIRSMELTRWSIPKSVEHLSVECFFTGIQPCGESYHIPGPFVGWTSCRFDESLFASLMQNGNESILSGVEGLGYQVLSPRGFMADSRNRAGSSWAMWSCIFVRNVEITVQSELLVLCWLNGLFSRV